MFFFLLFPFLNLDYFSSGIERRYIEKVFGEENFSQVCEKTVFNSVRSHRGSKEREFSGNIILKIDLRDDSDQCKRKSSGCVFCSSRFTG